jgi:hypothetical protein
MAESDLRDADETGARPENAAPPAEKSGAAPDAAASGGEAPVPWRVEVNVIRSVYVARNIVSDEAPSGDFARMETATDGVARRGAYVARLADAEPAAAGAPDLGGDDMLRSVYVARTVAGDAQPANRGGRSGRGKRRKKAAAPVRKAGKPKAKRATRPKAKKRAPARRRRGRR